MKRFFHFILSISLLFLFNQCKGQDIFIYGRAMDNESGSNLSGLFVVNKRTAQGSFADGSGNFSITVHKTDTILIAAQGYQSIKLSFVDSIDKAVFNVHIYLQKLKINLAEVEIFQKRELSEIEKDITRLKSYDQKDYRLSGYKTFQSPITALYQTFSRTEKNKRKVAEMRMADEKRNIVRELLFRYTYDGTLVLESDLFDEFISFTNISDEFLRTASQYQLILFFKERLRVFQAQKETNQEKEKHK